MISIRRKIVDPKITADSKIGVAPMVAAKILNPAKPGFFQFSHKIDYGLFLMSELAKNDEIKSLRIIADYNKMSFFFLQKVAFDLRKGGLIQADRGKNGGYRLTKSPQKISLKEILEALEGPMAVMHCLNHGPDEQTCVRESNCNMRGGLNFINEIISNALAKTSLAKLS